MRSPISASYLTLIRQFPLHPIRGEADYDAASKVLDRLAMHREDDLDEGERDYLETLEMLIEAFDQDHFKVAPDHRNPAQRLNHLMKQTAMRPADLMPLLQVS